MGNDEKELLPCPFCGGEARLIDGDETAYVQCLDMKMHRAIWFSGDNNAADEVRQQWNRRAPSAPSDLADRLRAFAKKWGAAEGRQDGELQLATEAASTIERLSAIEQERDALREALRPFADEANRIHPDWANERRRSTLTPSKELTVADFRRARAALLHEGQG